MTGASFDSNILIDSLQGVEKARTEIRRADRRWISRLTWIEVMGCADLETARRVEAFLASFSVDEISEEIGRRAAALRSERNRLKLADAIILASAQVSGRILVTRNTRDFPANLPGIRVPYTL